MQENSGLGRAMAMVRDLRARCPWDRAQTRETLRPYLVEEVMELDHALADGKPAAIREELSDLLLHLAFQLVIAEERGEFDTADLADDLEAKMRRRHPHLFDLGDAEPWEQLKRRERPERRSALDGIPPALPDLLYAHRLQERAATVGFDWPDLAGPIAKVREELEEVERELASDEIEDGNGDGDNDGNGAASADTAGAAGRSDVPGVPDIPENLIDEVGDLLFAVVNLARKAGVAPSVALGRANRKFRARFEGVERLADAREIDVGTAGLEALDRLWDEVKRYGYNR